MADVRRGLIIYGCLIVVAILLEVGDVDGRRGGGSRGGSRVSSRRSSYSGSSSSGRRSYSNVALSGRIMTGSSIYTSSTWRVAATAGLIYGGIRYTRRYPHSHTMPPICTNNYEKSPEGRVYGYFICPRENETDNYIYCCGAEHREYCCNLDMAQEYFSRYSKSGGISVGAICGITLALIALVTICFLCCKKRKQAGIIIRKFSKKDGKRNLTDYGTQEVPLNGPSPAFNGPNQPMPPSYDAAVQSGYGGADGLPYGPPQPQPPSLDDGKPGLPPPDLGGAPQPYWTPYPPTSGAPYPPSDAPYPLSGDAPYPSPSGAPYPPAGDAPYPPSGASYPLSGGAPYPPSGAPYPPLDGAPYPPPSGAPYPTMEGTPYPPQGAASYPSSSTIASAPAYSENK